MLILFSGSRETGSTAKKVTASDSAKPGPHIHIFFLAEIWHGAIKFLWKSGWGLGAGTKLLGVSNGRKLLGSKVLGIYLKLSLATKFFPKTIHVFKKFKKMIKYSFFCKFFTGYD